MFELSTSDARPDSEIHRCMSGEDCRGRVFTDGVQVPALTVKASSVCELCWKAISRAVDDMAETWAALHMAIGDSDRRMGQKVSGSHSAPINVNTDVDALKSEIAQWLVAAASAVAEQINCTGPKPRNSSDTEQARIVAVCTDLVGPNIDILLSLGSCEVAVWLGADDTDYPGESVRYESDFGPVYIPNTWIDDFTGVQVALHLVELRRRARKLLALTDDHNRLPLPCPRCNAQRSLTRRHERLPGHKEIDQISCANCKLDWPYEQYRNLTLIWVRKDEMEREKLEKELAKERQERKVAEFLLAQRDWVISLAMECPDVKIGDFAAMISATLNSAPPGEFVNDKDAANLVGVLPATIRQWATRGQIARYTADDGSVTFLASEVYEYAKANPPKRNGRKARGIRR